MELNVYFKQVVTGTLSLNTAGQMCFEYSKNWLNLPEAFPVSQSIPLSGDYIRGTADHRFFANLLPEAGARESICRGLGISVDNDFQLLAETGGECAGALQILPANRSINTGNTYEPIPVKEIDSAIQSKISFRRLTAGGKLRLSLAGAQDKWAVFYDGERLFWPVDGAPSSHILKFPASEYKNLSWNESYVNFLASCLKLPVMEVAAYSDFSLTQRYDRIQSESGIIERLHQEDFCQALGFSSFTKYENEGGPSLKAAAEKLREISSFPARDMQNLLRWHIFNLLAGNSDGHAKNISILYRNGNTGLAPFYDLVCTGIYDGISNDMAFATGDNHDPGQIRPKDWKKFADDLGMNTRIFYRILDEFISALGRDLPKYRKIFEKKYGTNPVLDQIDIFINKRLRRVSQNIK